MRQRIFFGNRKHSHGNFPLVWVYINMKMRYYHFSMKYWNDLSSPHFHIAEFTTIIHNMCNRRMRKEGKGHTKEGEIVMKNFFLLDCFAKPYVWVHVEACRMRW